MILRLSLLILILIECNFHCNAQIIKVDKDWVESDTARVWQGVIDITADNIKNTLLIFQMASSLQISHSWNKTVLLSAGNLRLLYEDTAPLENAGFQHFRYIRTLNSKFSVEVFSQVQFDQLLKIKMRWVTGTGLRYTFFSTEAVKVYVRPGYMYEYEKEDSTGIINNHHRMSNYITLRLKNSDKARFYFTLFYQPRLDDFTDYRLSPAWTIELSFLKKFYISISGDLGYDSKPVAGVDRTTYIFTQGLGWRL